MRPDTAAALFAADVQDLASHAALHRVWRVTQHAPFEVTFLVRRQGIDRCVRVLGSAHYPLDPCSVQFCNPANLADTGIEWWPDGANGINKDQKFVCAIGFLEGHKQHPPWPIQPRKNRIEAIVDTLVRQILQAEPRLVLA
jgi:hypothetical protein